MTMLLVIETSSSPFGVVLSYGNNILFDSTADESVRDKRDVSFLVSYGLDAINKLPRDIDRIAVNTGPGGLSSVRSGVAFANAMAYALTIAVYPFTTFELIGLEAWKKVQLPVLCSARGDEGNAYVAVYEYGRVSAIRYGALEVVAAEAVAGRSHFAVAGAHRSLLKELLPGTIVEDSGIQVGSARTVLEMGTLLANRAHMFPDLVTLVNEESVGLE